MPEAGPGKIRLFHDFAGVGSTLALTAVIAQLGDFYAGGNGFADGDAGINGRDALSGTATITSGNTDKQTSYIATHICFDVALMAPIVLEARVQLVDLDAKEIFFGVTSILTEPEELEDIIIGSSATVVVIPADMAGFYFSDELTASATEWHGMHNGGSAAASLTVADVNLGTAGANNPTAGEWQILRLQIDNNGTVEWFINGGSVQKIVGAVSTTSDVAVILAAAANSGEVAVVDCDYLKVTSNRDWTV